MTTINAVNSPSINFCEFVKLSVGNPVVDTYYFCNASGPITVSGMTFTNLGNLLTIGTVQRDIKATSSDMAIQLTGLASSNIALVLSSNIKGSLIEIWRGFFDSNNQIITTPTTQFFKRYQGIINNVSITEDWNDQTRTRLATANISCSSMRIILQNRISGIKTNINSWQNAYADGRTATDTSMTRVDQISNVYFDFGAPPMRDTQSADTNVMTTNNGGDAP